MLDPHRSAQTLKNGLSACQIAVNEPANSHFLEKD